jgi:RNA polymerase sigma factor (TIGR02999 family)
MLLSSKTPVRPKMHMTRETGNSASPQPFEPVAEHEVTRLLNEVRETPELFDRVLPLVYDDLKRIGHNQRRQLGGGMTMQTTALVHEACLKLRDHGGGDVENRLHLKRLAAMVMRQLIFDYARRQQSAKRGGGAVHGNIDDEQIADRDGHDADLLLAIERVLDELRESSPRMAEVLTARFFAGYSIDEIAEMLGTSSRTVTRDLTRAKAWLKTELADYADDFADDA